MKIRVLTGRGRKEFVLDYYAAGRRVRKWFKSRAAAEAQQASLKDQKRTCGEAWVDLDPQERSHLMTIYTEAKGQGVDLRTVWEAYKTGKLDAVPTIRRTLGQCIEETTQAKTAENLRPRYVRELGNYLRVFADGRTEMPVDKLTVADIEGWFDGRGEAPATRRSNLGRLGSMLDLAWRRHYIAENPCLRVAQPRLELKPPRILTPKQAADLLTACRRRTPNLLPWLALGLFAGIRPDELRRLTWADVVIKRGIVTIDAAASKVRRRRVLELHPTARAWLAVCKGNAGPIMPSGIQEKRQRRRLVKAAKIEWSHDLLRHSGASYLLALHKDAPKVANMLGHSTRTLESVYKNLVTPEDCRKFWSLVP